MALSNCCESFQAVITAKAAECGKTPEQVYGLWREYSDTCRDYDQSAIWSEFLNWYAEKLQPLPAVLTEGTCRCGLKGWLSLRPGQPFVCLDCQDDESRQRFGWTPENSRD